MPKVIKVFTVMTALLVIIVVCNAQMLNLPESVVYDQERDRYLVSNWSSGSVVQIDSWGVQSIFISYQQCYAGLHISGNTIYAACREYGVKGFDLETGLNVLNVPIFGATNINDITSDNAGNLYVSYPTESVIYKVDIATQNWWTFADQNLDTPNGIMFDEYNNRLVLVSYKNYSPVQAISLDDSVVTTITNTTLHGLDGITRDDAGNWYVSSWYSNACFKFDSTFSGPPELFSNHNDDPADIFYDEINSVLAVPLFFTNDIEFVSVPSVVRSQSNLNIPAIFHLYPAFPNPFNPTTALSFQLSAFSYVNLTVYDIQGREVAKLINGWRDAGVHEITFDASELASGIYIYHLTAGEFNASGKMVLIR